MGSSGLRACPYSKVPRVVAASATVSMIGSFCWGASILQFFEKTPDDPELSDATGGVGYSKLHVPAPAQNQLDPIDIVRRRA